MSEKRVRIFPDHPRDQHGIGGTTYKRVDGWYPCNADQERLLSQTLLHEGNPASPKLFQIVTIEEAEAIDRAERAVAQRNRRGTARRPVGPDGQVPDEQDEGEIQELRTENAQLAERLEAQERQARETQAKLDAILARLGAAPPLPSNPDPVAPLPAEPSPDLGNAPPDPKAPSPRTGAGRRRPGAKAGAAPSPAEEPPADPPAANAGAVAAFAHFDDQLRQDGFTIGDKALPAPPRPEGT